MIVGYPGHFDMRSRVGARGERPLVFNPMVSLYDALVLDRGRWKPTSLPARALKALDRRALQAADLVVADTEGNADFLAELAEIPRERVSVCFLGAEEPLFRPGWNPHGALSLLLPREAHPDPRSRGHPRGRATRAGDRLQDRRHRAAREPPRERRASERRLARMDRPTEIPAESWSAGCALGIFGRSEKVARVIPNKAFEALACGTPLVTADTLGAGELLSNEENALLVPPGDPAASPCGPPARGRP